MERMFDTTFRLKIGDIIVGLFSILPIIDSINGFMVRNEAFSIGSLYKVGLTIILLVALYRKSIRFTREHFYMIWISIGYVLFSVFVNLFVFHEDNFQASYMIKLVFNIIVFVLLMENYRIHTLTGVDFYNILNRSTWVFLGCYLIPYALGVGERTYAGDIGYKAFFYAQNELSLIIIVMFYFCIYKLYLKVRWSTFLQTCLVFSCAMLTNTKSTILACCIGMIIWLGHVFMKQSYRTKLNVVLVVIVASGILHRTIMEAWNAMLMRFSILMERYYEQSIVTSILSARNYYIEEAWNALLEEYTVFRIIFGNGFCSNILVEMDIIDLFFYLGFIGAISAIVLLICVFKKSYHNFKSDQAYIRIIAYGMVVVYLFVTGHVLFMATAGCYFVLLCCFNLSFGRQEYLSMQENCS